MTGGVAQPAPPGARRPAPPPLTPLEIATCMPLGEDPDGPVLASVRAPASPIAALEAAMLPALCRPPCVVSFSGGRDSSAMLAVAMRLARREGLAAPIPVTLRFPGVAESDESDWQERVVAHVGVSDWQRIEVTDELDLLGPLATGVVRRLGVHWPPNLHLHVPLLERAAGGSLITGIDGDGVLGSWRWAHVANLLARRTRPTPRDVLRVGLAAAPAALRRRLRPSDTAPRLPWLRPDAQRAFATAFVDEGLREPVRWDARTAWKARRRYPALMAHGLETLAADADAAVVHPLFAPSFLRALADAGGARGFGSRSAVMRALFADILPEAVLARPTKATFSGAIWGPAIGAFALQWDGEGANPAIVDFDALRRLWRGPPSWETSSSTVLLQSAWLATAGTPVDREKECR